MDTFKSGGNYYFRFKKTETPRYGTKKHFELWKKEHEYHLEKCYDILCGSFGLSNVDKIDYDEYIIFVYKHSSGHI